MAVGRMEDTGKLIVTLLRIKLKHFKPELLYLAIHTLTNFVL